MAAPIPFTAPPAGGHIVGQPFTVVNFRVPMDMTLQCNCTTGADRQVLAIKSSTAVQCPLCEKVYNAIFNPSTKNIEMFVGLTPTKDPS
jgi:hypothetical protein